MAVSQQDIVNEQTQADTEQREAAAYAIAAGSKPGAKTSEFWVTVILMVLAKIVLAYGMYKGNDAVIGVAGIMASLAGGAYNLSRGKAKSGGNNA